MPDFSSEFWIGTIVAFLALLVGLAVTVAMDARTKGELRFAAACFIVSAGVVIYGVEVWQVSITLPSWARVPVIYLLLALVITLTGEGIRWADRKSTRLNSSHLGIS